MFKYTWECWGQCLRHLPTAGVCEQRLGTSLRLLLTAGVSDQHLGMSSRLLPTACVCDQCLGVCTRHLPNTGVCDSGHATFWAESISKGTCTSPSYSAGKAEKWTYCPFFRDFRPVWASNRGLRTLGGQLKIVQKLKDLVFWPFLAKAKHL